jgi:serine/threonine protein kinase
VNRTGKEGIGRAMFAAAGAPRLGDTVGGRFRIEAEGGVGASGLVFRARDLCDGGDVALKVTYLARAGRPERAFREARALASVRHSAVVRYIAHGYTDAGAPFLAMQWIEGETLAQRLARDGLTPTESLRLALCLSSGLAALHDLGIVHRDLKPSNILLAGGRVEGACIVDLGVSRDLNGTTGHTGHGEYVGTPRYMSPEQIRDPKCVQGASDVFALGCILHECLCGAPAFDAGEVFAVLAQILFAQPPRASHVRPALPAELDRLLGSLLARRPERRPEAGAVLNAKLRAALENSKLAHLEAPSVAAGRTAANELTADSGVWTSGDARVAS